MYIKLLTTPFSRMTTVMNTPAAIIVPDNWDDVDDTPVIPPVHIDNIKKQNKWVAKYPELAKHFPLLLQHMKHASKTDTLYVNNETIIRDHLEAVSLWKPNKSFVLSFVSKQEEKTKYKRICDAWSKKIDHVGLKENSSILERELVQTILEKCCNTKYEHTKYVFVKVKNPYGIIA